MTQSPDMKAQAEYLTEVAKRALSGFTIRPGDVFWFGIDYGSEPSIAVRAIPPEEYLKTEPDEEALAEAGFLHAMEADTAKRESAADEKRIEGNWQRHLRERAASEALSHAVRVLDRQMMREPRR